jgi:hypothetical protein
MWAANIDEPCFKKPEYRVAFESYLLEVLNKFLLYIKEPMSDEKNAMRAQERPNLRE